MQPFAPPASSALALAPGIVLARGRAHEATGAARTVLGLLVAGRMTGPVVWIGQAHVRDRAMGDGLRPFLEPGRMIFVRARRPLDSLWAAEEALRSGAAPLVVADLSDPPALTAVRRLHLAAEAGAQAGAAPLALLLTPEGEAPGVETRWRLAPIPGWARDGTARWRLTRLRARVAPPAAWEVRLGEGGMLLAPA